MSDDIKTVVEDGEEIRIIDTDEGAEAINEQLKKLKDIESKGKTALEEIKEESKNKKTQAVSEAQELYDEFALFLEKTAGIVADSEIKNIIPTPIKVLNAALGGGFPEGSFNMLVGQSGCGKSMLAAQTGGSLQQAYKNSIAQFLDSEETMTKIRLMNLGIYDPPINPYVDVTIEKIFQTIEGMCTFKASKKENIPSLLIWDSIANTLTMKEREVDDINKVIGYKARLLSILLPKYIAKMGKYGITVLAVNQLRDKLDMGMFSTAKQLRFMQNGKTIPGGNSLIFNCFILLEMKQIGIVSTSDDAPQTAKKYGFDGFITSCKSVKNKLFAPNVEVELVADFNTGFSDFWTSYNFLVKHKILKTGAWNHLMSNPDIKFRAKDAEEKYYKEAEFKEIFDKAVDDTIKIHIIDKYSPKLIKNNEFQNNIEESLSSE